MMPHFAGRVGPGWDQLGAPHAAIAHQVDRAGAVKKRPLDYFKMFYADTAHVRGAHAIQCCLEFFGDRPDAVRLRYAVRPREGAGVHPVDDREPGVARAVGSDEEKICSGNARRILGVRERPPTSTTRSARRSAGTAARWPACAPTTSAAHVVRALLARSPDLDPAQIDDVTFGDANGAGEDNRNVARMAVLLAGLPTIGAGRDGQPAVRLRPGGRDAAPRARSRPATRRWCSPAASSR